MIGGAALGFLVGFGFPKIVKRLLQIGIPVALVVLQVKKMRDRSSLETDTPDEPDWVG